MKLAIRIFLVGIAAFAGAAHSADASTATCDVETRSGKRAFGTVDIDTDRLTLIEDRGQDLFYWITELSVSPMVPALQFDRKTECRLTTTGSLQTFACEADGVKVEINLDFKGSSGRFYGQFLNLPDDPFELVFANCR